MVLLQHMQSGWHSLSKYAALVRLSHTIFGLPFTLVAALLANTKAVEDGLVGLSWTKFGWILLAFTAARTAAMGFNRIVDRKIDAKNPRTQNRELPAGLLSLRSATTLTTCSTLIFIGSAFAINKLAGLLTPICLIFILGYSFFKRFSWSSHLILGLALGLGPGGAWVAVYGGLDHWIIPLILMFAVALWVAGFDILYSLQDKNFDETHQLHSIPVRFGIHNSLWISAGLHAIVILALIAIHQLANLNWAHGIGIFCFAAILIYEHWIVRPDDLTRIDRAFFDLNGYVSLLYFGFAAFDICFLG